MSENTKRGKQKPENKDEEETLRTEETEKPSYYYDDAHGYEVYHPEDDEDEEKQIN